MNKEEKAKEVVLYAKENDIYKGSIPEEPDSIINAARKLVDYANSAYKQGNKSTKVTGLLGVAGIPLNSDSKVDVNTMITLGDDPDEVKYREAINEAPESGLPIPNEIEGTVPDFPEDLTTQTDKQIRYLHGAFSACSSRAAFLLSQEKAGELAAKQIADYYYEDYLIKANKVDPDTKKAKTIEFLKAEALHNDTNVAKWRGLQNDHKIKSSKLEILFNIYSDNVARLSREMTMREIEREG